ncbi:hypothetical protein ACMX2H_16085 [Arthrobacter sulfonylureivorans]|uniref:hypothetical protein n=1 Tax=Arthrobacter sulfonylureivorans TaxID=2486855 RepID=UPI0039E2F70E
MQLPPAPTMTEEQAEQIATFIHSIRPDWHVSGIVSALGRVVHQADTATVALALLHAAADPAIKTPGILSHQGPHWHKARGTHQPAPPTPSSTLGSDTSPMCERHPQLHEWECKTCNRPTPPPANFRDMIKAATAAARNTPNPELQCMDTSGLTPEPAA